MRIDTLFTLPWWLWGVEIHFDQIMYDWLYSSHWCLILEMLTLGHSPLISDRFCEITVYTRHILSRDYLALRVYPFWEDVFLLGHSHLVDFDIETQPSIHDCYFQWIIKLLTLGFSFLNILGSTWIPSFLRWTSKHPTFDTIIPTSILAEPDRYWVCLFHHLT